MKIRCEKRNRIYLSGVLAVILILLLGGTFFYHVFAGSSVLFSDNFENGKLSGWYSSKNGTVADGVYTLNADSTNSAYKAGEVELVAVSAKTSVAVVTLDNGFTKGMSAYVTACGNETLETGYDFGIGVSKTGQTYIRLYRRDASGEKEILYQTNKSVSGLGTIQQKKNYEIKLVIAENHIISGYVNDVLVVSMEDATFSKGYVGIRAVGAAANFDNFKMEKVPKKEVEKITINSCDESVASTEALSFSINVQYNSVYGSEILNQNSEGVTVTGLDGTTGKKNVTISYGGKSVSTVVNVTDKFVGETLFSDEFSGDALSEQWLKAVHTSYNRSYDFEIKDGYATTKELDLSTGENIYYRSYITPQTNIMNSMADYKNYSIKLKASILKNAPTASMRYGQVILQFAKDTQNQACSMEVSASGTITVKYGSNTIATVTASELLGWNTFPLGTEFEMRADVYEGYFELYLNNKLVCRYARVEDTLKPYLLLWAGSGTVRFNEVFVTELEKKGDYAISGIAWYNNREQRVISSYKGNSPYSNELLVQVTYRNKDCRYAAITQEMVSAFQKVENKTQKVTLTYKGKNAVLSFTYVAYLFFDTFDLTYKEGWQNTATGVGLTFQVQNQMMKFNYEGTQKKTSGRMYSTIPAGSEWTNYAVSADVFFDATKNLNDATPSFSLYARTDAKLKNGYIFVISCSNSNGQITGYLRRVTDGVVEDVARYTRAILLNYAADGKTMTSGHVFNMKLELRDNVINTYLDGTLIGSYIDDPEKAIMSGTAGYDVSNFNGTLDNFYVEPRGGSTPERLELVDTTTGKAVDNLEVIRGNELELWNYEMNVIYSDGGVMKVLPTEEMLSEFNSDETGKQKLFITYRGCTQSFVVNVTERPEYTANFEKLLKKFAKTVSAKNEEDFISLKEIYDTLTPWEVSQLSEKMLKKYEGLLESYDRYKVEELGDAKLLANERFEQGNLSDWPGNLVEYNFTHWHEKNGVAYQAAVPYDMPLINGWRHTNVYAEAVGISADCYMMTDGVSAGVAFNMTDMGYYVAWIDGTSVDSETQERIYKLNIKKLVRSSSTTLAAVNLEDADITLGLNMWFNLRLTMKGSTLCAYVNDTLIITYEDLQGTFTYGESGIAVTRGDCLFDNVRVYGTAMERPGSNVTIKSTSYEDDFEDEAVGASPSHWVENSTAESVTDNWKVYQEDGKVYGTKTDGNTETWLHVFDDDPQMTFRFKASGLDKESKIGIISRRSPSTAFVKVGYDHSVQKWYIASQTSKYEGADITYGSEVFKLKEGTWYTASLVEDGKTVSLKIDDVTVVNCEEVDRTTWGVVGFFTENAGMMVDDIHCTFASGDIPQDGVISYTLEPDKYGTGIEFESLDGGKTLLAASSTKLQWSTNSGLTWTDVPEEQYKGIDAIRPGRYRSFLKMSNGKFLSVDYSSDVTIGYKAYTSTDLFNWTAVGTVVPDDEYWYSGLVAVAPHQGSLVEYTMEDGHSRIFMPVGVRIYDSSGATTTHYTRVYYSDDFGVTWTKSENDTRDVLPGYEEGSSFAWLESKIVQCSDGTLRLYYTRNNFGCMQYTVSKDGGVTWEGLYQIPELQCAMTSFAITQDTDGTYYMVWVKGKNPLLGTLHPRTQLCLLKSTDGMNWSFLTYVERMTLHSSAQNGTALYQIVDPMVYVSGDYVHIAYGRSEVEYDTSSGHQAQRLYYVRIEKDKLTERAWDASTIENMGFAKTVDFETAPQTKFGVGDVFQYEGTLKVTTFSGEVYYENISTTCMTDANPNMLKLGTQHIQLWHKYGYDLSYDIEVVKKCKIKWDILGEGKIDNQVKSILEGDSQSFEALPETGWKLDYVLVNGEKVQNIKNNKFTISNASGDYEIQVCFTQMSLANILAAYWWLIAINLALIAGGAGIVIYHKKKKKGDQS